jgi:hypothetical protein
MTYIISLAYMDARSTPNNGQTDISDVNETRWRADLLLHAYFSV